MTARFACKDGEHVSAEAYDELMLAYKTLKSHLKVAMDVERRLSLKCAKLEEQRNYWIDSESFDRETVIAECNAELEKIA